MSLAEEVRATTESPGIEGTRILSILMRVSHCSVTNSRPCTECWTAQALVSLPDIVADSFNCRGARGSNATAGKVGKKF